MLHHEVNTPQELQRTFDVITAPNQMHFVEVKCTEMMHQKLRSISKVFAQQNK